MRDSGLRHLEATVNQLAQAGITFCSEVIAATGAQLVLVDDGNPIALFQPSVGPQGCVMVLAPEPANALKPQANRTRR